MLEVEATPLPGVLLLKPQVHRDARGSLMESYNRRDFAAATGMDPVFVQDNRSRSAAGVLRGLHYQVVRPQGKLVQVLHGRIFDVAVDLRRSSPTVGRWFGVALDAKDGRQLWIPPGLAHGFLALTEAEVFYKASEHHAPEHERVLAWDDPRLAIAWPLDGLAGAPLLSPRDRAAPGWNQAELYG